MSEQKQPSPSPIFVFGSNLAGRHGAGSAAHAVTFWGAEYGIGEGPTGRSYALPTKDRSLRTMKLESIRAAVERFLTYARERPEVTFRICAIGCGLAGYNAAQIAPFFADAPGNCELPEAFKEVLK